jgi:hypothetical protein
MGLQREQDRVTQEGRMNGDVFKPDEKWAKGEVAAIVRMAIYSKGVEIDDIASVQNKLRDRSLPWLRCASRRLKSESLISPTDGE